MADAEQDGDWYCQNCGYLSASRVTFHETCDECHIPVAWHTVSDMTEIEKAVAAEREACAAMADQRAKSVTSWNDLAQGQLEGLAEDIRART